MTITIIVDATYESYISHSSFEMQGCDRICQSQPRHDNLRPSIIYGHYDFEKCYGHPLAIYCHVWACM